MDRTTFLAIITDTSGATLARFRQVDKRSMAETNRWSKAPVEREGELRSDPPVVIRGSNDRIARVYWLLGTIVTFAATIYDDWNSGRYASARDAAGLQEGFGTRHLIELELN